MSKTKDFKCKRHCELSLFNKKQTLLFFFNLLLILCTMYNVCQHSGVFRLILKISVVEGLCCAIY